MFYSKVNVIHLNLVDKQFKMYTCSHLIAGNGGIPLRPWMLISCVLVVLCR